MKAFFNADHFLARTRKLPLLLAGAAALSALFSPALRAQNIPAFTPQSVPGLPAVKAAQKPKSDKWVFSLLPVGLQKNPQVDYTFVTEMTDEGRKLPQPSVDQPVYYISHSIGQRDVGDAYGGTKPIPYEALKDQLTGSLASAGFRPSDADHPPTQVIFMAWGMHNKITTPDDSMDTGDMSDGSDDGSDDSSSSMSMGADTSVYANLLSRAKIVGGQKFADDYAQALAEGDMTRFSQQDDRTETLCYEVQNECYYLLVTSMDADALRHNEKKILWTTTISTVSQGISFQQTLPIMINNASYYLGRETDGADIVRKRAYKSASVTIGDATVVEYMSATTSASGTAATPAPAPAPAPATSGTAPGKP